MEWFLKVVRDNFSNFEGRARRKEYWMFILFNLIIQIGFGVAIGIFGAISPFLIYIPGLVMLAYALYVFIPNLAVLVRRLHDTGNSGWMLLVAFIPLIGGIWLLVLLCTEGQYGPNQYGPDPKAEFNDDIDEIGVKINW
ncbi:inner membrane protein YhaI [Kordia sp. SMS9]|uniref:DUF805 domain-containing protein n=1 Tax=Kordia sp. SMS9 TaxID=2282170 RepID=UPI000E0D45AC|nr:DUF805 domain-containing protein [Kordia sp. SMS9]AXG70094.1 inner membrane protein YhaI [Kordia sp. SMS9]